MRRSCFRSLARKTLTDRVDDPASSCFSTPFQWARDDDAALLCRRFRLVAGEGAGHRPAHARHVLTPHAGRNAQDEARAALHGVRGCSARVLLFANRISSTILADALKHGDRTSQWRSIFVRQPFSSQENVGDRWEPASRRIPTSLSPPVHSGAGWLSLKNAGN